MSTHGQGRTIADDIALARELLASYEAAIVVNDRENARNAAYELVKLASNLYGNVDGIKPAWRPGVGL